MQLKQVCVNSPNKKIAYVQAYIQKGEVMQSKIPKNYRFTQDTVNRLEELVQHSGKNCTEIIEDTIKYMHGEYRRALKGMEHDEVMISQIMGTVSKNIFSDITEAFKNG
jgi:hypothetical protein